MKNSVKTLKTELKGQEESDAAEASIQGSVQVPEGENEQGETQQ